MASKDQAPPEFTLELGDTILVETPDQGDLEFEVVGLTTPEGPNSRAILYCDEVDEFLVSDLDGSLLEDEAQSEKIVEEFLKRVEEEPDEGEP